MLSTLIYGRDCFFPRNKSEEIPPGQVMELEIPICAGGIAFNKDESLRLEIKGHDPILPEYPALFKGHKNLNKGRHVVYIGGNFPSALVVRLTGV